jgi:hypothetical protein
VQRRHNGARIIEKTQQASDVLMAHTGLPSSSCVDGAHSSPRRPHPAPGAHQPALVVGRSPPVKAPPPRPLPTAAPGTFDVDLTLAALIAGLGGGLGFTSGINPSGIAARPRVVPLCPCRSAPQAGRSTLLRFQRGRPASAIHRKRPFEEVRFCLA